MSAINRHNYETFFLLYVDGELSASEKASVERFVQENPDLAFELTALQDTVLVPETDLSFAGKHHLYRNTAEQINLHNYEEQFLYYVDDALDAPAREAVERFVLQHPELQSSFTLLKQTRLEPETMVYPYKADLYRAESKEKPVVFLQWRSMAVAAALLGLIVTAGIWLNQSTIEEKAITAATKSVLPYNNTNAGTNKLSGKAVIEEALVPTAGNKQQNSMQESPVITNTSNNQPLLASNNNTASTEQSQIVSPIVSASTVDAINTTDTKTDLVAITGNVSGKAAMQATDLSIKPATQPVTETNPLASQVVYKELDTEDDSKSLLLGSLEINKDKLRGFFRKASSIFRSKAKQEEERTEGNGTVPTSRSL